MRSVYVALLLLWLTGCGGDIRADQATTAASFDTGCSTMKIVERIGNTRFKLEGCGRIAVYECQNVYQPSQYGRPDDYSFINNLAFGADTVEANCRPITVGANPSFGPPAIPQPQAPPQMAPGASVPRSVREMVKSVMEPVVKTARASCPTGEGNDGIIEMKIHIEASGRVQRVEIANATASEAAAKCLAGITQMATFPPHNRPEPIVIFYPVVFGDPSKIPDLMKNEVDAVMGKISETAKTSCPRGEGNDGTVQLVFTVEQSGRVEKVQVAGSTASEATTKCVVGIAQMAKFPPLRKSTYLVFTYPVVVQELTALENAPY